MEGGMLQQMHRVNVGVQFKLKFFRTGVDQLTSANTHAGNS